jgi:hypothetical protein
MCNDLPSPSKHLKLPTKAGDRIRREKKLKNTCAATTAMLPVC